MTSHDASDVNDNELDLTSQESRTYPRGLFTKFILTAPVSSTDYMGSGPGLTVRGMS